jgi:hypothetical protein
MTGLGRRFALSAQPLSHADHDTRFGPGPPVVKSLPALLQVASRAYVPMAGSIVTWLIVAAAIGHADTVRILTAMVFTRAARIFLQTDTHFVLRQWNGAERRVYRKSLRRAVRIEAVGLIGAWAIVALIMAFMHALGQDKAIVLTAILALALPARYIAGLFGRRTLFTFRFAIAACGPFLVAIVFFAHPTLWAFAAAVAGREWLALIVALLLREHRVTAWAAVPGSDTVREDPLTLVEVAAFSAARSRTRIAYRVSRTLLGFIPFGGIVARTGRALGAHRRLAPWAGRSVYPIMVIAAGTFGGAIIVPLALAKPATLLGSASLLRLCATASNVLLWWRFYDGRGADDEDDDDDD